MSTMARSTILVPKEFILFGRFHVEKIEDFRRFLKKILFSFTLKFEIEIILISVEATKVLWYASLSFQFYLFPPNSKAS